LDITEEGGTVTVTDETWFGSNNTTVELGGAEVERSSKGGRKQFMLSGWEEGDELIVQCRLFQRGDGWYTQQRWRAMEDGSLQEVMVLKSPGEEDVLIRRAFDPLGGGADATGGEGGSAPSVQSGTLWNHPVAAVGVAAATCAAVAYLAASAGSKK
jgi:hypothetical protein